MKDPFKSGLKSVKIIRDGRKEIHEKTGNAIEELYPNRLEEYYELLAYHYVRSDNKDIGYDRLYKQRGDIPQAMEYLNKGLGILEHLGTLIWPDIKGRVVSVKTMIKQL